MNPPYSEALYKRKAIRMSVTFSYDMGKNSYSTDGTFLAFTTYFTHSNLDLPLPYGLFSSDTSPAEVLGSCYNMTVPH